MRVSIITILDNTNYGTYLQALALSRKLSCLGAEVEIVDYIRYIISDKGFTSRTNNPIKKIIYRMYSYPRIKSLRLKDRAFLKKFVNMTSETYYSNDEIKRNLPIADIYMTGSDQVWNSIYNRGIDKAYYLEYVPDRTKKVAYAASIGMKNFPTEEIEETKKLLLKYDIITVREKQAQDLIEKLGLPRPRLVLDPTLLLDSSEWLEISKVAGQPLDISEPYILIYSVETRKEDSLISHYAKIVAKSMEAKIYQVSYNNKKFRIKGVDVFHGEATPEEFLQLVVNSKYMIVSSFHGTAFAINLHKQFLTITPNRFNSRIDNLLTICDLKDREIKDKSFNINSLKEIDYTEVDKKLNIERKQSESILKEMITIN